MAEINRKLMSSEACANVSLASASLFNVAPEKWPDDCAAAENLSYAFRFISARPVTPPLSASTSVLACLGDQRLNIEEGALRSFTATQGSQQYHFRVYFSHSRTDKAPASQTGAPQATQTVGGQIAKILLRNASGKRQGARGRLSVGWPEWLELP